MDLIFLYETELRNLCNCFKWVGKELRRRDDGGNVTMYNISLTGIITYNEFILIKIYLKEE
jgi:hypothetical protein